MDRFWSEAVYFEGTQEIPKHEDGNKLLVEAPDGFILFTLLKGQSRARARWSRPCVR